MNSRLNITRINGNLNDKNYIKQFKKTLIIFIIIIFIIINRLLNKRN